MQTCGRQGHLFGLWKENNKVTILIDADGCPVVDLTVQTAAKYKVPVLILCDCNHAGLWAGKYVSGTPRPRAEPKRLRVYARKYRRPAVPPPRKQKAPPCRKVP